MVLLDHGGRHPGEVELLAAPADVRRLVEHLWIQGRHGAETGWRVVADTAPHLIASVTEVAGTRHLRVQLVGARTHAATVNVTNRVLTVGVRLRPGAVPVLTGSSARELTDQATPIDCVFQRATLADLELGNDAPPDVLARELVRLVRRASPSHGIRPLDPGRAARHGARAGRLAADGAALVTRPDASGGGAESQTPAACAPSSCGAARRLATDASGSPRRSWAEVSVPDWLLGSGASHARSARAPRRDAIGMAGARFRRFVQDVVAPLR